MHKYRSIACLESADVLIPYFYSHMSSIFDAPTATHHRYQILLLPSALDIRCSYCHMPLQSDALTAPRTIFDASSTIHMISDCPSSTRPHYSKILLLHALAIRCSYCHASSIYNASPATCCRCCTTNCHTVLVSDAPIPTRQQYSDVPTVTYCTS